VRVREDAAGLRIAIDEGTAGKRSSTPASSCAACADRPGVARMLLRHPFVTQRRSPPSTARLAPVRKGAGSTITVRRTVFTGGRT